MSHIRETRHRIADGSALSPSLIVSVSGTTDDNVDSPNQSQTGTVGGTSAETDDSVPSIENITNNNSNNIGLIIGAAAGGFVCVIVIAGKGECVRGGQESENGQNSNWIGDE